MSLKSSSTDIEAGRGSRQRAQSSSSEWSSASSLDLGAMLKAESSEDLAFGAMLGDVVSDPVSDPDPAKVAKTGLLTEAAIIEAGLVPPERAGFSRRVPAPPKGLSGGTLPPDKLSSAPLNPKKSTGSLQPSPPKGLGSELPQSGRALRGEQLVKIPQDPSASPTRGMQMPTPSFDEVEEVLAQRRGLDRPLRFETLSRSSDELLDIVVENMPKPVSQLAKELQENWPDKDELEDLAKEGGTMANIAATLNNCCVRAINRFAEVPYSRGLVYAAVAFATPVFVQSVMGVYNYLFGEEAKEKYEDDTLSRLQKTINKAIGMINDIYNAPNDPDALIKFKQKLDLVNKANKDLTENGNVNTLLPPSLLNDLKTTFYSAVKQQYYIEKNKRKKIKKTDWGRTKVHIPIKHTTYGEPQLPN